MTDGTRTPLIIGHRGSPATRPEHSRSSYELAIAQGADAVEPDVVASRDGVLLVRHENEISGTTDVADRPEFADRRRTQIVDGRSVTGWFTEDFDWAELATLRCRERLPLLRPLSAEHDGAEPLLRLSDVLAILDAADGNVAAVIELKHAEHFAGVGLPLDALLAAELSERGWATGRRLYLESFEERVLHGVRDRGVEASLVYLMEDHGGAQDLVGELGSAAPRYAEQRRESALAELAARVDGISVDTSVLLRPLPGGVGGSDPAVDEVPGGGEDELRGERLVERAHAHGLLVFAWTLRAENAFLEPQYRSDGVDAPAEGAVGDWQGQFGRVLATGVDGAFVDQVDLGVRARQRLVAPAEGVDDVV
ncbi:glycerophosphodiester phosphodiesterase family protein [Mycetocola reblochoni]|uniref:glycerophosphodiester phosphodiesterase n=2 Tax=Mycetocola reblochoni TaxID=331618 RepID=A0A1R4KBA5_9MICO|nr:glycerophosphodiester phosphodiesterase family protein [Mycetocola reblochoni]RLP69221.1 glycerophosphodiester phosphodiesterase [Mycetocola reblochoni]SJN41434.1 Glycerophosphoryl diester phosphodiesterase [Mycetocola reblochoni REB411]